MIYTVTNLDTGVTTTVDPSKDFGGKKINLKIINDPNHPLAKMLDGKITPTEYLDQEAARKNGPEPGSL